MKDETIFQTLGCFMIGVGVFVALPEAELWRSMLLAGLLAGGCYALAVSARLSE